MEITQKLDKNDSFEDVFKNKEEQVNSKNEQYTVLYNDTAYGIYNSKIEAQNIALELYNENSTQKIFSFDEEFMKIENYTIIPFKRYF